MRGVVYGQGVIDAGNRCVYVTHIFFLGLASVQTSAAIF